MKRSTTFNNVLLLTKEEAYTLVCPGAYGVSGYLLEDGMAIRCTVGDKDIDIDWYMNYGFCYGFPEEWHAFRFEFADEEQLNQQLPYIKEHLSQCGTIHEPAKAFRTRLGDIWQECKEYLLAAGTASNKWGMPRPGILDLRFTHIWLMNKTKHYTHDYRVIGLLQPIGQLLCRKYKRLHEYNKHGQLNERTEELELVSIDNLDIYQLTDLVDDIKKQTRNINDVYRCLSDNPDDIYNYLTEVGKKMEEGDKVIVQCHHMNFSDEHPGHTSEWVAKEPYLSTIIRIDDRGVAYTDRNGVQVHDVLYNIRPYTEDEFKYALCSYKWQQEELEKPYK